MPLVPLPPDPDSLEQWKQLPQNKPSREALPPVGGGARFAFGLLIAMAVLIILSLLFRGTPS